MTKFGMSVKVSALTLVFSLSCSLLLSCADDPPVVERPLGSVVPPSSFGADNPAWVKVESDALVLASVNGVSITERHLAFYREALPALGTQELLEVAIDVELLAQEATGSDLWRHEDIVHEYRQALIRAFLQESYEPRRTSARISDQEVTHLFNTQSSIRKVFDHAPEWHMTHLLLSCCDPKMEDCGTPDVVDCFALSGTEILRIYNEVKAITAPIEGDPVKVDKALADYRADVETRYPELAYRQRGFFY